MFLASKNFQFPDLTKKLFFPLKCGMIYCYQLQTSKNCANRKKFTRFFCDKHLKVDEMEMQQLLREKIGRY
jgi:hypothetical protein